MPYLDTQAAATPRQEEARAMKRFAHTVAAIMALSEQLRAAKAS